METINMEALTSLLIFAGIVFSVFFWYLVAKKNIIMGGESPFTDQKEQNVVFYTLVCLIGTCFDIFLIFILAAKVINEFPAASLKELAWMLAGLIGRLLSLTYYFGYQKAQEVNE